MLFLLFWSALIVHCHCQEDDYQVINIRINEELPVGTILFITPSNVTYRLFDSGRNQNGFAHYNTSNGHILLAQPLDRERLCVQHVCSCVQCQIIIELIEWQAPYRLLQLQLHVDDINDHRPTFSADRYRLQVVENVPFGFELPLEPAYDADLDENSRVNYELIKPNDGPFELLRKANGAIALKVIGEIDREERDSYQYELVAYDYGQPRQQSSTKLYIQINDLNDNAVVLSETYIHLHVSESTPVGTELTHINATDQDSGLNGKIHYSISNGLPSSSWMDYFRLGETTGILTLVNALDYEAEQTYRLTIQVRDLGENSQARFLAIDISVLDENDNFPRAFVTFVDPLLNDSIISMAENTPVGHILAHISVSDEDAESNGELAYSIEQGDDMLGIQLLDQRSLLLVVNHPIDREDQNTQSNRFILIIADHGKPPKSIRLEYQIQIIDINDSPPRFDQSRACQLHLNTSRNRSLDRPLLQVHATDADLGENSRLSYSILPPHDHLFLIDNQGQIFNTADLNQSSYHLQVMATDHGETVRLNSTHECHIVIASATATLGSGNANASINLIESIKKWKSYYSTTQLAGFSLLIVLVVLGASFCVYKFVFIQQRYYKENKTYHLYVSIPRKSYYTESDSPGGSSSSAKTDDNHSEEHERLVYLHDKDSLSDHHRPFSRTVQNSYPSSISSISKLPHDSAYESVSLSKHTSRPLSISTTCTSIETEASVKVKHCSSLVVRLAEEENSDV